VFINARGWFWQPGGWNRLNNGPRFTNAPPGFHPPIPPADLRVAGRAPGQVIRPGETPPKGSRSNTGNQGRIAGNGENHAESIGEQIAARSSRHVFTNDEVQTIAPETEKTRPAVVGKAVRSEQSSVSGGGTEQHSSDRSHRDGEPARRQMSRMNETPSVSRSTRESAPSQPPFSERVRATPPVSQSPAVRQQAPSYSPPIHQSAPPAAAPAPARSQAAPSQSSSSGDSSRGKNR
jgi:hypothetical protein